MPGRSQSPHPFGQMLALYRARKPGLSQRKLAELAGYDQAVVARMALGKKDLTGPSGRERVLRLIETLAGQGALSSTDEANALLQAADMPPLFERLPADAKLLLRLSGMPAGHRVRRTNLPSAPNAFIGRIQELAEVRALLDQARLVTLTGAGGCGKTRLAQRVAGDVLLQYADGVWYAEFAALENPAALPEQVAGVFGLTGTERPAIDQLAEFLRDRHNLLVLDNCEHVIDAAAALVARLLSECARMTVLATSRESLDLDGELAWRVPPMQPADAATLFVERARLAAPSRAPSMDDRRVSDLCGRLDGLPLALELAATQLATMSLDDIALRLEDRFALLSGGRRGAQARHRTLRALVDWSHDLISARDRIVFRRLGVFSGGWTRDLACAVAADDSIPAAEVEASLDALVRASLVVVDEQAGVSRYRYLETLRHYALTQLEAAQELDVLRHRHALAVEALAWRSFHELSGDGRQAWFNLLGWNHANLRSAIEWCFGNGGQDALGCNIVAGLFKYLNTAPANRLDASRWSRMARARMPASLSPMAQAILGILPMWVDRLSLAETCTALTEALPAFEASGDVYMLMLTKHLLAREGFRIHRDYPRAAALLDQAMAHARQLQQQTGRVEFVAHTISQWAIIASLRGERDKALGYLYDALACIPGRPNRLIELSVAALLFGMRRHQEAVPHLERAYATAGLIGDAVTQLNAQAYLAWAAHVLGDSRAALGRIDGALAAARETLPAWHLQSGALVRTRILIEVGDLKLAEAGIIALIDRLRVNIGETPGWYCTSLDLAAYAASARGDATRAARLFAAADREYEHARATIATDNMRDLGAGMMYFFGDTATLSAPYTERVQSQLGEADYATAYAEGRAMTLGAALALATSHAGSAGAENFVSSP